MGLLWRGLPSGIAQMDITSLTSGYLSAFADRAPTATTTISGEFDSQSPIVGNMIDLFRRTAPTAFADGESNDLVVSAESARGNCATTHSIASDHFTYFERKETLDKISQVLRDACDEENSHWLKDTDMSRGLVTAMKVPQQIAPPRRRRRT